MESNEWVTGEVTLSVDGGPLRLKLSVPLKPVKPQVMLPVFQKMANLFTDLAVSKVEAAGERISCQMGCGACCRQPVPLAETEIHYIARLVADMPEPRRNEVTKRFEDAAAHFHATGWFERFENCPPEEVTRTIQAYFAEGVACPFLEEESCSIHPERPVVCREYLVTSPAINCANPLPETIRQVPLPVKALDGLLRMGRTDRLSDKGFLPMVFALEWAEKYPDESVEKTGEEWLAEFFTA